MPHPLRGNASLNWGLVVLNGKIETRGLTFRLNSHEAEPKLYEVEPKLHEVEPKLYEVESKLYEVDTNINKTKTKTNNNKAKCSVVVDDVVVDSVIEAISNGSETRGLTFRLNSSGNSGTRCGEWPWRIFLVKFTIDRR